MIIRQTLVIVHMQQKFSSDNNLYASTSCRSTTNSFCEVNFFLKQPFNCHALHKDGESHFISANGGNMGFLTHELEINALGS